MSEQPVYYDANGNPIAPPYVEQHPQFPQTATVPNPAVPTLPGAEPGKVEPSEVIVEPSLAGTWLDPRRKKDYPEQDDPNFNSRAKRPDKVPEQRRRP